MNKNFTTALTEICDMMAAQKLPRWNDFPDLDLYLDQVISLANRYLGGYPGYSVNSLNETVIANYVKAGVLPAPVQKNRFTRTHLSHLVMVSILKASLPLAAIQALFSCEPAETSDEAFYNRFCDLFESIDLAVANAERAMIDEKGADLSPLTAIYDAALRAQAEQTLATKLFHILFPNGTGITAE